MAFAVMLASCFDLAPGAAPTDDDEDAGLQKPDLTRVRRSRSDGTPRLDLRTPAAYSALFLFL